MFEVGQKIVCVDDSNQWIIGYTGVVKGNIYTIRAFTPTGYILLEEVVNPPIQLRDGIRESGFKHSRFRPINSNGIEELLNDILSETTYESKIGI